MHAVAGAVPKLPEVSGGDPPQGAGMPAAPQPRTPLLNNRVEAQRRLDEAQRGAAAAEAALAAHRAERPPKAPPPLRGVPKQFPARRRSRGAAGTPGEQGQGQGPPVPPGGGGLPLLGPEAAAGAGILTVEFFKSIVHFEGEYCQHSAALKWLRKVCEDEGYEDGYVLSSSRKTAVAAIIHPPGVKYWFNSDDMRLWSWWEMVAQMDEKSIKYVVEDGDCSRGLVACEVRRRTGSYDHSRQVYTPGPQLAVWDFVLKRNDGTAVRLHPQWSTNKIPTFAVEGQEPTQIPSAGLGMSDGPGTFRYYKELGQEEELRFGRRVRVLV